MGRLLTPDDELAHKSHLTVFGEHYGQPPEEIHYQISVPTMAHFLRCEALLDKFMEFGIHNWENFETAMKAVEDEEKQCEME